MNSSSAEPLAAASVRDEALRIVEGVSNASGNWTVMAPQRGWGFPALSDVWRYRELLYFLALRDIKVRYKQTALGVAWTVLQPLLTMLVFSIVFGHFAKIPSDGVPYPIFVFAGLVPWTFFATAVGSSGNSLVNNANLISKVYFPRVIVPTAACLPGVVDISVAVLVLIGMMPIFGVAPSPALLAIPVFVLMAFSVALAVSLWLSALNVRYRDVRQTIPFLIQVWLYATPIAYPASLIHGKWHLLLAVNPMTGVVNGFRWAIYGAPLDGISLVLSAGISVLALLGGLVYFRQTERSFADFL